LRQKRARQQAAEQGTRVTGARPFGYTADGMVFKELEAQAVRDAYQWLLDGAKVLFPPTSLLEMGRQLQPLGRESDTAIPPQWGDLCGSSNPQNVVDPHVSSRIGYGLEIRKKGSESTP
jgi:hypothetical protein